MKTAFIFPGQGAQIVGMGMDLAGDFPEAARIFEAANNILDYDLGKICFGGPAEKLNTTTISQPALFTTSVAILEVLKTSQATSKLRCDVTAGLSLGEYTALYAAGVMDFEQGLRLVQKRGQAMQAAADQTQGSMVSIIGLDAEKTTELCNEASEGEVLCAVNFNCPGQIVLSGSIAACKRSAELAEKYGAIKAIPLEVAGAFHTELMSSAETTLREALANTNISDVTDIKVIANIRAEYYSESNSVREGLAKQLTSPILWQKCMERLLADGVENFYEIGPGRVLTGLMRRINRKIKVINISSSEAIRKLTEA
ncbi:MAG: ACP S-malonyltransferase [Planctomycetota bacterium]|jgi:[acyl-carrier-protein] S-malonyltransferase